jgi:nitrite reductase/ring-hydroxylating ferredoxin subunit
VVWLRACAAGDLGDGEALVVDRPPDRPIAVFNVDGDFYAIDDTCTHEEYSLAEGYIDGDVVECALHMAKFSIRTGKVLSLPATRGVATYDVKVEDGVVFVDG